MYENELRRTESQTKSSKRGTYSRLLVGFVFLSRLDVSIDANLLLPRQTYQLRNAIVKMASFSVGEVAACLLFRGGLTASRVWSRMRDQFCT
jgi:hypothetical protein